MNHSPTIRHVPASCSQPSPSTLLNLLMKLDTKDALAACWDVGESKSCLVVEDHGCLASAWPILWMERWKIYWKSMNQCGLVCEGWSQQMCKATKCHWSFAGKHLEQKRLLQWAGQQDHNNTFNTSKQRATGGKHMRTRASPRWRSMRASFNRRCLGYWVQRGLHLDMHTYAHT